MGSNTARLALYKPDPGDAAATWDTEFPANMNTLDNSLLVTTFNAKGDLIAATADNTEARLAVGTNGQVLTANSATSTGLEWQTPGAASHPDFFDHDIFGVD